MRSVRFLNSAGAVRVGMWDDGDILCDGETFDVSTVSVLPPCTPSKILCIGLNYADHVAELEGYETPQVARLSFVKPPSALVGHRHVATLPSGKSRIDYEAELGVVIGEQCRHVDAADAMDVVAGYTCVNDISNRDAQWAEDGGGLIRAKAIDNSAPMGPVVATPEHVSDDASIQLRVNGEVRQDSAIDQMVFDVPHLIEAATEYVTLEPGDVIATGTPAGVGPLEDGDAVEIEIGGVGTLEHGVRIP